MNMTKEQAIEEACSIVAIAYIHIGDFSEPSDCFCHHAVTFGRSYHNAGKALAYVKQAVTEKLKKDSYMKEEV